MTRQPFSFANLIIITICVAVFALSSPAPARAQTETVIHSFRSASVFDGIEPFGGMVAASNGALYGTTSGGGKYRYGAVYKLSPPTTQGGAWGQTILYSFTGGTVTDDGSGPSGSIVLTKGGKIYGTTQSGGRYGDGTVYELSPPTQPGNPWTETTLYSFSLSSEPIYGLVAGSGGRLYGTTYLGGHYGVGSVFAVSPPAKLGDPWTEETIHSFSGGGAVPQGYPTGLVLDASGSLYGATSFVNGNTGGVVFQLSPPSSGRGAWTENILYAFTGEEGDGSEPSGGLVLDSAGALYGNTLGGGQFGGGTAYKLSPPAVQGGTWTESVLYSFEGVSGGGLYPIAALAFDSAGALYGVTESGGIESCGDGDNGCGTAFKLSPPTAQGGTWTEQILHSFAAGTDGNYPQAQVIVVGTDVYGTTMLGGTGICNSSAGQWGCGTVFQITQ